MKKVLKNISRVLFSLLLVVSIFGVVNVLADQIVLKITKVEIKEKSNDVTVNDVSITGDSLNNNITFTEKGEYIKYEITIKNTLDQEVTIKNISDDNDSIYLEYTYDNLSNVKLNSNQEKTFELQIKYIKETNDNLVTNKSVKFNIEYEKEDGTTSTETITNTNNIINPKTGDNIGIFILLGTISLIGLVLTFISKRHLKKVFIFIGMVTILVPIGVLAVTKICKFEMVFKNNIKSMAQAGLYKEDGTLIITYNNLLEETGFNPTGSMSVIPYMFQGELYWVKVVDGQMVDLATPEEAEEAYPLPKTLKSEKYKDAKILVLPKSLTSIPDFAFAGIKIDKVILPDTVDSIGSGAFYSSDIKELVVKHANSIGDAAFDGVKDLVMEDTSLDDGGHWSARRINHNDWHYSDEEKTRIAGKFFQDMFGQYVVSGYVGEDDKPTIPSSVTTLGEGAFYNTNIKELNIPEGVTTVESYALSDNRYIRKVTIPTSMTSIADYSLNSPVCYYDVDNGSLDLPHEGYPFIWGCMTINPYIDGDYAFYDEARKEEAIAYIGTGSSTTVPSYVKIIGDECFTYGYDVTSITLPEGLEEIKAWGLLGARIESIVMPASLKEFGQTIINHKTIKSVEFKKKTGWYDYPNVPVPPEDLEDPVATCQKYFNRSFYHGWLDHYHNY